MNNVQDFIGIHESYKKSTFQLEVELSFWHHFITQWAIPEYQKQFGPRLMNSAGYSTYDSSAFIPEGYLKMSTDIHEIHSQDLEYHSESLFNWVMNSALVRGYNALEILMLQAINTAYLHLPGKNPSKRVEINKIHSEVVRSLALQIDRNNNKHLIQFLKEKSPEFASWIQLQVRVDMSTTWEEFFYLNSILRHSIVHQAMILHKDLVNDVNSKSCRDLFERHFKLSDVGNNSFELHPIQALFNNFLALTIEFAVNTLKFSGGQQNLDFLNLT
jgi:hypothetical protein